MTFLDVLRPGDKIDIRLVSREQNEERGGVAAKLYKSIIMDELEEDALEIAMPMDGTKLVLFQVGLRINMIFYARGGLYRCDALVRKRYKKDNRLMLYVELAGKFAKFQRREYFRITCSVDAGIYPIDEELAGAATTQELFQATREVEMIEQQRRGTILDISGGGLRLSSEQDYEPGAYILTEFRLTNDRVDANFYLVGQIVASEPTYNDTGKYVSRCKFLFKDLKDREQIVQFVFEEECRLRRREIR